MLQLDYGNMRILELVNWRKCKVKTLYIIGNGFDCYGHGMNTKYTDFRKFLINKYPEFNENFGGILESTLMPNGDEVYNMDEVVGSLIRTIDECSATDWNNLEECLGNEFICNIAYDNEWAYKLTDIDEDDNIFHSVYENEDLTNSVVGAYRILINLFREWVFSELANIDFQKVKKLSKKPSFRKSLFLSFNYTLTLEKLYRISSNNICHIHGNAGDRNTNIYFGHGDDTEFNEFEHYIGVTDAYNSLKRELRKNTNQAVVDNINFFRKLSGIKKIYSYGFSFSDVDMIYLEELGRYVDVKKVRWYFNQFDWKNNIQNVEKVKHLGFKVRVCRRWKDSNGKGV